MTFRDYTKYLILFFFCFFLAAVSPVHSKNLNERLKITILANNYSGYKSNVAKAFELSDLNTKYLIEATTIDNWQPAHKSSLYIALGQEALIALNKQNVKATVLSAMITSNQWNKFIAENQNSSFSAIFYDPDPVKQLILAKIVSPIVKSVGILLSEDYLLNQNSLNSIANKIGITINLKINRDLNNFYRDYAEISDRSNTLLLLPDKNIYNQNSIPKAILTSYRQGKFIIGYSKGMVRSGAIASTYTSASDYTKDLIETVDEMLENQDIELVRFSKYYSVETNTDVAKSLGLILQNNNTIKSLIDLEMDSIN